MLSNKSMRKLISLFSFRWCAVRMGTSMWNIQDLEEWLLAHKGLPHLTTHSCGSEASQWALRVLSLPPWVEVIGTNGQAWLLKSHLHSTWNQFSNSPHSLKVPHLPFCESITFIVIFDSLIAVVQSAFVSISQWWLQPGWQDHSDLDCFCIQTLTELHQWPTFWWLHWLLDYCKFCWGAGACLNCNELY